MCSPLENVKLPEVSSKSNERTSPPARWSTKRRRPAGSNASEMGSLPTAVRLSVCVGNPEAVESSVSATALAIVRAEASQRAEGCRAMDCGWLPATGVGNERGASAPDVASTANTAASCAPRVAT
jgi:hypothetical protein